MLMSETDQTVATSEPGTEASELPKKVPDQTAEDEQEEVEMPNPFAVASNWISTGSSWGTSWLSSAKEKTKVTLDSMKKDLSEFSHAMSQEVTDLTNAAKSGLDTATTVVKQQASYLESLVTPDDEKEKPIAEEKKDGEETAAPAESKPKEEVGDLPSPVDPIVAFTENAAKNMEKGAAVGLGWMKSIAGAVADTVKQLAVEETTKEEDNFTEVIRLNKTTRLTNLNPLILHGIQTKEATYLNAPENEEGFEQWVTRFNLTEHDGEINMLLANNPPMRQIFTKIVPSKVDSQTFWSRYFYAVQLAEMDEEMSASFKLDALSVKTDIKKDKARKTNSNSPAKSSDNASPASDDSSMLVVKEQPTSPAKSADDWSVCSDKNEVEEIGSGKDEDEDEEEGPMTPRPKEEKEAKSAEKSGKDTTEDGWIDWDE